MTAKEIAAYDETLQEAQEAIMELQAKGVDTGHSVVGRDSEQVLCSLGAWAELDILRSALRTESAS